MHQDIEVFIEALVFIKVSAYKNILFYLIGFNNPTIKIKRNKTILYYEKSAGLRDF